MLLAALALLPLSVTSAGQDWPQWRGPTFDGASEVCDLPAEIARERARWVAELSGPSAATPAVLGERVYVTAASEEDGVLLALCLDRATGALRWEDAAGSGYRPGRKGSATRIDDRSDYASPSPIAHDGGAIFLFGNGDLVAYDLAGERRWARNLQADHGDWAFQWTFGASPTLHDGRLYLPVLQRDVPTDGAPAEQPFASYLLALDPATGADLWKVERPSDARMESRESYATAVPHAGELLVVGGDVITGHDPASGKELWRWGTWNEAHRETWWRLVPSAVVGSGRVLVCAPKRAPVYALDLAAVRRGGTLGPDAVAWASGGRANPVSSDVPTPLHYRGRFFVLSERGSLSRVAPADGEVEWTVELPDRAPWEASPTGADGKVWCLSHAGVLAGVDAESGKVAVTAELGDEDEAPVRASVAAAHGALFVRTSGRLFCFGRE